MSGLQKPHAVCVPFPAQGHINPMMQLAKLLHSRGFYITFVNTEFNHGRLIKSKGLDSLDGLDDDFQFQTIPDGLPPSDRNAMQDVPALCDSTRKNMLGPFKELLGEISSSEEVPPVSCVVSDGVMSFAIEAAQEIGVPETQFWTASACGFMAYLQFPELVNRGIFPFKDESYIMDGTLDNPIDWIPGMRNIHLRDIPSFVRTTNADDIMFDFMGSEAQGCLKSQAIIFNTFDELEREVLQRIAEISPPMYSIGPLPLLLRQVPEEAGLKSFRSNLWKEDHKCLEWLDEREPDSVLYVNYGSITVMSDEHLMEFAWGLANSKHPFLWVIRPDLVKGDSINLPHEFLEETRDRAFLTSWGPQDRVLAHPSVGAFLSHCGWNSIIETLCGGVPLICWPFFAEQQTNCRYACIEWGIGMEVNPNVKRDNIAGLVKEVMKGEKGEEMRRKAKMWKEKASEATSHGGSSYNDFDEFVNKVLNFDGRI